MLIHGNSQKILKVLAILDIQTQFPFSTVLAPLSLEKFQSTVFLGKVILEKSINSVCASESWQAKNSRNFIANYKIRFSDFYVSKTPNPTPCTKNSTDTSSFEGYGVEHNFDFQTAPFLGVFGVKIESIETKLAILDLPKLDFGDLSSLTGRMPQFVDAIISHIKENHVDWSLVVML